MKKAVSAQWWSSRALRERSSSDRASWCGYDRAGGEVSVGAVVFFEQNAEEGGHVHIVREVGTWLADLASKVRFGGRTFLLVNEESIGKAPAG